MRSSPKAKMFGIGFDNQDGHHRITKSEDFLLLGGSEKTHERMQETAIKMEEALKRRGKRISEMHSQELVEILQDVSK